MNLQEFVYQTLHQIAAGVAAAKKEHHGVAPPLIFHETSPPAFRAQGLGAAFPVEFDVAVTVSDKTEGGVSAGLTVVSLFKAGSSLGATAEQSTVSRIRF